MPTAQNATAATITMKIKRLDIQPPLVHAIVETGARIDRSLQHTQGARPMKERISRHAWKAGLIAALLPLAAGSANQGTAPSNGTVTRLQPAPLPQPLPDAGAVDA